MQASYLQQLFKTLKPTDVTKFKRYLVFQVPSFADSFSQITDVLLKSNAPDEQALLSDINKKVEMDHLSKKLYELKNIAELFVKNYIADEDKYTQLNNEIIYTRYLRNNNLPEFHVSDFKESLKKMDTEYIQDDFRNLHINLMNEARKYFYHKYYAESNYKSQALQENFDDLKKMKRWLNHSHLLDKIFYDFTLKAAYKIEENTLQANYNRQFEPVYFDYHTYLLFLNSNELPVLYKTFILDILEGVEEVSGEDFQNSVKTIFNTNYEGASENVKYNLLIALIASEKTDKKQRLSYYRQLIDLRSELNPGLLNSYILECLDEDVKLSRAEFKRLKSKAVHDTENELNAIEGIIYSHEKMPEKAIAILNKVIVYQQDNNYFEVNFALLESNLAIGEVEIADSIYKKLHVFYHKYKDSLSKLLSVKYYSKLNEMKKKMEKSV